MKRCGNCGHELKMRSSRVLDSRCPHCGEIRYSKTFIATVMRLRLLYFGAAVCLACSCRILVSVPNEAAVAVTVILYATHPSCAQLTG